MYGTGAFIKMLRQVTKGKREEAKNTKRYNKIFFCVYTNLMFLREN